jgi:hypothetical protein
MKNYRIYLLLRHFCSLVLIIQLIGSYLEVRRIWRYINCCSLGKGVWGSVWVIIHKCSECCYDVVGGEGASKAISLILYNLLCILI